MEAAGFDYELPPAAIAQQPVSPRDCSRLLAAGDPPRHLRTRDLPELVGPGDLLVLNDTRVLPARLHLAKDTGGAVEVLTLEPTGEGPWWEAMVRPSRRVPEGSRLVDGDGTAVLEVGPATGAGTRLVRPLVDSMEQLLDAHGAVPLPPYVHEGLDDPERYQTVYARRASSVAAPTAGLHLTEDTMARCRAAGAEIATVDLSVGMGTFRPVETDQVEDHAMHTERYRVPLDTWQRCQRAERVVAVGTTVVRALESVGATGERCGRTELFIRPGFRFDVVDALVTNFHLPRSTLLVMLEAFMGPGWRELYRIALAEGYRFLSFGDAMFVERQREDEATHADPGRGG